MLVQMANNAMQDSAKPRAHRDKRCAKTSVWMSNHRKPTAEPATTLASQEKYATKENVRSPVPQTSPTVKVVASM